MNENVIFELDVWTSVGARLATIGIVAVVVSVIGGLVIKFLFKKTGKEFGESLIIILSISLIGGIVGDLSGSSQESVAGQLVPAVLTLIGAFGVYVFGQKRDSKDIINVAILAFMLSLSISYASGYMKKRDRDTFVFCRDKYSDSSIIGNDTAYERFNQIFIEYCGELISRYTD